MSRALPIVTVIVSILHSYVSAQAPSCLPGFSWAFNSLGQSPCTMTVALGGVCVAGPFTLEPLQPGFVYLGPTQVTANSCRCSTVYYSLLSACGLCQNETFLDWSIYDQNCTIIYNQVFTDSIPSNVLIPHYAYLDVVTGNTFNVAAAMTAGGPESSSVPQSTSSPTIHTTAASTSAPTTVATASSKKSIVGPIVGGVVGGIALLGIVAGLIAFICMRNRKRSTPIPSTYASPQTMMSDVDMKYGSTNPMSMASGKLYNPNDPTTFPAGYSPYPDSPGSTPQQLNTMTGNSLVSHGGMPVGGMPMPVGGMPMPVGGMPMPVGGMPMPVRPTQYSGAPEV